MTQRSRAGEAPYIAQGADFERSTLAISGVSGNTPAISRSSEMLQAMPTHRLKLLDRIVARVAETRGITVAEIHSRSRQHDLVVARAQIAWLAVEANLTTLSGISRYLHHSPSALTRAVAKYRRRYPHLFRPEAIGSASAAMPDPAFCAK
jgi:hypothetical protein